MHASQYSEKLMKFLPRLPTQNGFLAQIPNLSSCRSTVYPGFRGARLHRSESRKRPWHLMDQNTRRLPKRPQTMAFTSQGTIMRPIRGSRICIFRDVSSSRPFGELVLRYRRLISMFSPSPFDVWDKYLEMVCLQQSGPLFELVPAPTEVLGSGGPALALAS